MMSPDALIAAQLIAEREQLIVDLQNARQAAQETGEHEPTRIAAVGALLALVNYLKAIDIERALYAPLLDLSGALADAERGLSHPLTRPLEFKVGDSTAKIQHTLEMAEACAAVTLMRRAGRKKEAYVLVANNAGVELKALRTYRKNITAKRAPELAKTQYDLFIKQAMASCLPLTEQADQALKHLSERRRTKL